MPRIARSVALAVLLVVAACGAAGAHSYRAGAVAIGHAWGPPAGGPEAELYFPLLNEGAAPDRLVGATTPRAARAELRDGARRLDGLDLPVRRPIPMRPGALHLRLIGLTAPLADGERVPVTLRFQRAGEVTVEVWIEPAPYAGRPPG